jgi:hypothetical protein
MVAGNATWLLIPNVGIAGTLPEMIAGDNGTQEQKRFCVARTGSFSDFFHCNIKKLHYATNSFPNCCTKYTLTNHTHFC